MKEVMVAMNHIRPPSDSSGEIFGTVGGIVCKAIASRQGPNA